MAAIPRILFTSKDAPDLPSGYGIIAKHLAPRFADHYGTDNILLYCPVYQRDSVREWKGIKVLPGNTFDYGEDMIEPHYKAFECNILLMLGDWFPLSIVPTLAAENRVLWVQWGPWDFSNIPGFAQEKLRYAIKVVPFAKQAERMFKQAGLNNVSKAVYPGLDFRIWKPLDRRGFPKVMGSIGYSEDSYNILIVAANQHRKYLRESLEGIRHFVEAYPQANTRVYLHSHIKGERSLDVDAQELGLQNIIATPDQYQLAVGGFPEEYMAMIFACSDVVLDVSMEGFGLSHIQAQSQGVPVVCLAEGAGPELVKWGVQVPSYSIDRTLPLLKPVPHPAQIATAIETLYLEYQKGNRRNQHAIDWVQENCSWDKTAQQWFEVIDEVMEIRERNSLYIPSPSGALLAKSREVVEILP